MAARYLLDTNICIYIRRQRPPAVLERFRRLKPGEAKGEPIGNNDLWIAAHAKAAGLIVVTNNEREFKRVPGLQVRNWATTADAAHRVRA